MWPSLLFAAILLLVAGWMTRAHIRSWQRICRQSDVPQRELDYRRNQFRRRVQTSAMLAVLGVGLVIGQVLIRFRVGGPWMIVVYWAVLIVLILWLALLAVADMVATQLYFGRLRQDHLVEEARLKAQLRQWRQQQQQAQVANGNGKQPTDGSNGQSPHC